MKTIGLIALCLAILTLTFVTHALWPDAEPSA